MTINTYYTKAKAKKARREKAAEVVGALLHDRGFVKTEKSTGRTATTRDKQKRTHTREGEGDGREHNGLQLFAAVSSQTTTLRLRKTIKTDKASGQKKNPPWRRNLPGTARHYP